mmetsp:Transcript_135157/g.376555  ORF Transcript_135157/g.376555 Transcript_135157/m.376555 type:complete len:625 (-) Transcript_135157:44-1918(-)
MYVVQRLVRRAPALGEDAEGVGKVRRQRRELQRQQPRHCACATPVPGQLPHQEELQEAGRQEGRVDEPDQDRCQVRLARQAEDNLGDGDVDLRPRAQRVQGLPEPLHRAPRVPHTPDQRVPDADEGRAEHDEEHSHPAHQAVHGGPVPEADLGDGYHAQQREGQEVHDGQGASEAPEDEDHDRGAGLGDVLGEPPVVRHEEAPEARVLRRRPVERQGDRQHHHLVQRRDREEHDQRDACRNGQAKRLALGCGLVAADQEDQRHSPEQLAGALVALLPDEVGNARLQLLAPVELVARRAPRGLVVDRVASVMRYPVLHARGVHAAHGAAASAGLDQWLVGGVPADPALVGLLSVLLRVRNGMLCGVSAETFLCAATIYRRPRRGSRLRSRSGSRGFGRGGVAICSGHQSGNRDGFLRRGLLRRAACWSCLHRDLALRKLGKQRPELGVAHVGRVGVGRELLSSGRVRCDGAVARLFVGDEEGEEAHEDRLNRPSGIPALGVEVCHAQAQTLARLEAAAGRDHEDRGRRQGVLWREDDLPVVAPPMVGRLGPKGVQHEVPLQEAVLGWLHSDLRNLRPPEVLQFAPQAPHGLPRRRARSHRGRSGQRPPGGSHRWRLDRRRRNGAR